MRIVSPEMVSLIQSDRRVKDRVVVAAHLLGAAARERDVAHAAVAGDEAALQHAQGHARRVSPGEDLRLHAVGAGEAPQPFDAAQRALLRGALGDRQATGVHAGEDVVERLVIVDLPPDGRHVLRRAALHEKTAFVLVETKPHDVGGQLVDMQTDGVLGETPPIGEPGALNDEVAQVHRPEDVLLVFLEVSALGVLRIGGSRLGVTPVGTHRAPPRKSMVSRLNSSGVSHCTQCPTPAAR